MSKLAITLYGREYTVNCDPGEEDRLQEIVDFTETKMKQISDRVGNTTEPRLLMLTCLLMADELLEIQKAVNNRLIQDEDLLTAAVEHLKQRITNIASQVGSA